MFFQKKKLVICSMVLTLLTGALAGCGSDAKKGGEKNAEGKTYTVGIVQLVEHQALDDSRKGFIDGLKNKGFVEGKNIKFDIQNAQADQSNLQTIAQRFVNNNVDLCCGISTPAAQTLANATKTIPIVGNAITSFETAKLVKSDKHPGGNVTGVSDMAPVAAQLDLGLNCFPALKKWA